MTTVAACKPVLHGGAIARPDVTSSRTLLGERADSWADA
jgi:hypothetical protein